VFRLALINPNTDPHHTEAMGGVARAALPEGCQVTAVNPERGPSSIESEADAVVAAAETAALVRAMPEHDAYLIACFGDPGLDAARELVAAPVVGIGEAAYTAATLVGKRFGVVTTLPRSIPALEEAIEARGLLPRLAGILPLNIPVAEQGAGHPDTTEAIVETGGRLASEHGADALILACGGMADVARAVEERVGVPVCDGVAFGAGIAHALWSCGLRTSKAGAYAPPEPIPYLGMSG
jgi:allantoin racemase